MRILPSLSRVMKENVGSTTGIDDLDVEPVLLGYGNPEIDRRPAQRVGSDLQTRAGDGFHVDDVLEVRDVGCDVVVLVRRVRPEGFLEGQSF